MVEWKRDIYRQDHSLLRRDNKILLFCFSYVLVLLLLFLVLFFVLQCYCNSVYQRNPLFALRITLRLHWRWRWFSRFAQSDFDNSTRPAKGVCLETRTTSCKWVNRDLKIRGRRRQRKRRWKSEFAFFQSSSRLLQVTNFVKYRRTLLTLNS